jgi:hypothetical protein
VWLWEKVSSLTSEENHGSNLSRPRQADKWPRKAGHGLQILGRFLHCLRSSNRIRGKQQQSSGECTICSIQIALVLCRHLSRILKRRVRHLRDVPRDTNLFIYNSESRGPVHEAPVLWWNYHFSSILDLISPVGHSLARSITKILCT